MTNLDFKKLVNKYAVLLVIAYGINFLFYIFFLQISPDTLGLDKTSYLLAKNSNWLIQFIFNIIAALFVVADSKKFEIKNNLIIIATIIFSLLGISMFLILVNRETNKASA